MPLYEYECFLCGHHFERIRRVTDASDVHCPKCQGKVRRLLSAPALQFKGSGWYVTDYGKGNGRSTALAKTEEPASGTTAAPDSKPSEKTEKSNDAS